MHCVAYYVILLWKFYGREGQQYETDHREHPILGDNLIILREHIPTESVDLIYLDPPFNSGRNYNVLFKDKIGTEREAWKAIRKKGNC